MGLGLQAGCASWHFCLEEGHGGSGQALNHSLAGHVVGQDTCLLCQGSWEGTQGEGSETFRGAVCCTEVEIRHLLWWCRSGLPAPTHQEKGPGS